MGTKLTLIRGDDWEGIYINGKLKSEGHSIDPMDAIRMTIENDVTSTETKRADLDWLADAGSLPNDLSEVQLEK